MTFKHFITEDDTEDELIKYHQRKLASAQRSHAALKEMVKTASWSDRPSIKKRIRDHAAEIKTHKAALERRGIKLEEK